jgi:hypothetical protein
MTGVDLPPPSLDRDERQLQLKQVATAMLNKLDPALSVHQLVYVRVVKTPKPSILEVECESVKRLVPNYLNKINFLVETAAFLKNRFWVIKQASCYA